MRLLLVEDDEQTVDFLKAALNKEQYLVDVAADGETALDLIAAFPYDLVVLDIMLPKLSGIHLCQKLRHSGNSILIILLTSQNTVNDKIIGLDSGADDYLVKPVNIQELTARIRALIRRKTDQSSLILTCQQLQLDPNSREVSYQNQPIKLSRKEYLLLELFLRNQKRLFSRSDIANHLWSLDEELPTEQTVKSHIRAVRRRLESVGIGDLIENIYGQGYRINPCYLTSESPISATTEQEINALTAQIWHRNQAKNQERIQALDNILNHLQRGDWNPEKQETAIFQSHKLAGVLAIFGFEKAANLALSIESCFLSKFNPQSEVKKLKTTLKSIKTQIEQFQSNIDEIQKLNPEHTSHPTQVLLVGDTGEELQKVKAILETQLQLSSKIVLLEAPALTPNLYFSRVETTLAEMRPHLLILSLDSPESLSFCQHLMQIPIASELSVLLLISQRDRPTLQKIIASGAKDYILKPIIDEEVIIRVKNLGKTMYPSKPI